MKKREFLVGWAGALTVWGLALSNSGSVWGLIEWTAWVVAWVGESVTSLLNTVAPTVVAWVAAPLATAASTAYLANWAMNMIGIENRIARGLGLAWSAVAWFWAASVAQPFLVWAATAKGVWDIGKMVWNSEALKKLWTPKSKTA